MIYTISISGMLVAFRYPKKDTMAIDVTANG